MYQSVAVKQEISVYQSIYIPILTYGHELRVVTERMRLQVQLVKIRFSKQDCWAHFPS